MANTPSSDIGGNAQKMLCVVSGDWVNRGDWITAITNSGISTSGKAQSFIRTTIYAELGTCNRYQ